MPEGPEVRRHADALHAALAGKPLVSLTARTRAARAWLTDFGDVLVGRRVERVGSRGKNLIGFINGGYFFCSHLLMWGRWQIVPGPPPIEMDRRERARIVVPDAAAILFSAPIFEVGAGDPFVTNAYLRALGPDILPYPEEGPFDADAFRARLLAPENGERSVGAALLDQSIAAGIGNYLRAEILFACRLDPWRRVDELGADDIANLCCVLPGIAARAYATGGATVPDDLRARMRANPSLTYRAGSEWGSRHYVFRRTNLPCLVCGDPIRQRRQVTLADAAGEKERIIYFCPTCQGATAPPKRPAIRGAAGMP